ncbi:MAG: hypothetical protein KDA22_16940 [Phycisphaerales bacterium]|nr:hypothetical protein [Phycisphaerales bacterium]
MRLDRIKHAFAVDPPGPAEPTPEQREAAEWVCAKIVERRLSTPGLMMLEMARPLNFLSAQMMHFVHPGVWAVAAQSTSAGWRHFAEFLERRGALEWMARRIEQMEAERRHEGQ